MERKIIEGLKSDIINLKKEDLKNFNLKSVYDWEIRLTLHHDVDFRELFGNLPSAEQQKKFSLLFVEAWNEFVEEVVK